MLKLHVTPEEYRRIIDIQNRATMTLDGRLNEVQWFDGMREFLGSATIHRMRFDTTYVVVHHNKNAFHESERLTEV